MHVCNCSLCSFSKQLFSNPLTALIQGRTPLVSHWGLGAAGAASPYLPQALPQNKELPAWQGMALEPQGVRQEGVLSWKRKACPLGHPGARRGHLVTGSMVAPAGAVCLSSFQNKHTTSSTCIQGRGRYRHRTTRSTPVAALSAWVLLLWGHLPSLTCSFPSPSGQV